MIARLIDPRPRGCKERGGLVGSGPSSVERFSTSVKWVGGWALAAWNRTFPLFSDLKLMNIMRAQSWYWAGCLSWSCATQGIVPRSYQVWIVIYKTGYNNRIVITSTTASSRLETTRKGKEVTEETRYLPEADTLASFYLHVHNPAGKNAA